MVSGLVQFSSSISGIVRLDVHAFMLWISRRRLLCHWYLVTKSSDQRYYSIVSAAEAPPHISLMTHPAFAFHVGYLSSSGLHKLRSVNRIYILGILMGFVPWLKVVFAWIGHAHV